VGSDISQASRDVAFETAIRELAADCATAPWQARTKNIEFGGRFYRMSMVGGLGAFSVNADPEDG